MCVTVTVESVSRAAAPRVLTTSGPRRRLPDARGPSPQKRRRVATKSRQAISERARERRRARRLRVNAVFTSFQEGHGDVARHSRVRTVLPRFRVDRVASARSRLGFCFANGSFFNRFMRLPTKKIKKYPSRFDIFNSLRVS